MHRDQTPRKPFARQLLLVGAGALLGGTAVWALKPDPSPATAAASTSVGASTTVATPTSTTVSASTTAAAPVETTVPAVDPAAVPTTVAAAVDPAAPATTPAATPATPAPVAPTTAPRTTTAPTVAPAAAPTKPGLPPATPGTEGPHLPGDAAIASLTSYSEGTLTIGGTVADQATADRMIQRAAAFLPATETTQALSVDAGAPAPIPLFLLSSDEVFSGSTIRLEFAPAIVAMAQTLRDRPDTTIDIYLHTDAAAGEAAALELTNRQADSLREILIAQGIDNSRIHVFPKGSSQPLDAPGAPESISRRLEIVVQGLYA